MLVVLSGGKVHCGKGVGVGAGAGVANSPPPNSGLISTIARMAALKTKMKITAPNPDAFFRISSPCGASAGVPLVFPHKPRD